MCKCGKRNLIFNEEKKAEKLLMTHSVETQPSLGDAPAPTPAAPAVPEMPAPIVNRRATVGSTSVNEAKRVAVEAMNRVGAMRSTENGNGYYACVSPQCPAKCRVKKESDGTFSVTWSQAHKAACEQIGKQPARMQETARKAVIAMAIGKGRKEIQADMGARALSGNAFGGRRLDKFIERVRANIPEQISCQEGLAAYVASMPHKAVVLNEVMVGYHAWDQVAAAPSENVYVPHHPEDWDANAPIPDAAPGDDEAQPQQNEAPVDEELVDAATDSEYDGSDAAKKTRTWRT